MNTVRRNRLIGVAAAVLLAAGPAVLAAAPALATASAAGADRADITLEQLSPNPQGPDGPEAVTRFAYAIGVSCRALAGTACGIPEIRFDLSGDDPVVHGLREVLRSAPAGHPRFWTATAAGDGAIGGVTVEVSEGADAELLVRGSGALAPGDSVLVPLEINTSPGRYTPGTVAWQLAPTLSSTAWLAGGATGPMASAAPESSVYTSELPTQFPPVLSAPHLSVQPDEEVPVTVQLSCALLGEQQLSGQAVTVRIQLLGPLGSVVVTEPGASYDPQTGNLFWEATPERLGCGEPQGAPPEPLRLSFRIGSQAVVGKLVLLRAKLTVTDWLGVEHTSASPDLVLTVVEGSLGRGAPDPSLDSGTGTDTDTDTDTETETGTETDAEVDPDTNTNTNTDPDTDPVTDTDTSGVPAVPASLLTRAPGALAAPELLAAGVSLRTSVAADGAGSIDWAQTGAGAQEGVAIYDLLPAPGDTTLLGGAPRGSGYAPELRSLGAAPAGFELAVSRSENPCMPELGDRPGCTDDWATPGADLSGVTALRLLGAGPFERGASASLAFALHPGEGAASAWNTAATASVSQGIAMSPTETAPARLTQRTPGEAGGPGSGPGAVKPPLSNTGAASSGPLIGACALLAGAALLGFGAARRRAAGRG